MKMIAGGSEGANTERNLQRYREVVQENKKVLHEIERNSRYGQAQLALHVSRVAADVMSQ